MKKDFYVIQIYYDKLQNRTIDQSVYNSFRRSLNTNVELLTWNDVSVSIVLACRKLDSAYETVKLLANDMPDDGSVRMVNKLYKFNCNV